MRDGLILIDDMFNARGIGLRISIKNGIVQIITVIFLLILKQKAKKKSGL